VSALEIFVTTIGMALVTLGCRAFFLVSKEDLPMPQWLREGLRYAPIGALVAIVVPEIVMSQGHLIGTWKDPRLFGAAAATAWFCWRRDMLGTILTGTAVMLVLKLGCGW
jgi:branched-subunit amino acid transport protein